MEYCFNYTYFDKSDKLFLIQTLLCTIDLGLMLLVMHFHHMWYTVTPICPNIWSSLNNIIYLIYLQNRPKRDHGMLRRGSAICRYRTWPLVWNAREHEEARGSVVHFTGARAIHGVQEQWRERLLPIPPDNYWIHVQRWHVVTVNQHRP